MMNNNLINAKDVESTIYGNNAEFDANDGIGILVDMAKQGKIDPWNIEFASCKQNIVICINSMQITVKCFGRFILRRISRPTGK